MNKASKYQEENDFNSLVGLFLRNRANSENIESDNSHPDEDSLTNFVEGSLTEREVSPILKHLVDCGSCRRVTIQLLRLSEQFDETPVAVASSAQQSRFLNIWKTLTERIFSPSDEAVLAYHEESETENNETSEQTPNDSTNSVEDKK